MIELKPFRDDDEASDIGLKWPPGWYIVRQKLPSDDLDFTAWIKLAFVFGEYTSPLRFASKRDCDAAISNLHKSGITKDEAAWFFGSSLADKRRIACEALPW